LALQIGGLPLSQPDWGTKRICQSCATKFYDFGRTPIVCPKCGAAFDPEILLKSRRSRPAAAAKPSKPVAAVKADAAGANKNEDEDEDDIDLAGDDDDLTDLPDDEDEDESVIEDASELGEDDEEIPKVVPGKGEDE